MKDLKISKELISEVLNYEVDAFLGINKNEIDYTCCRDENEGYIDISINLYEFAFKCKEWAYIKGFIVEIGVHPIIKQNRNDRDYFYAIKTLNGELLKKSNVDEVMKSEPTAIIKACNWILEQNK